MQHLHSEFNQSLGHMKMLYEDLLSGNMPFLIVEPIFCANDDGLGMRRRHMLDFLEKRTKSAVMRKLYMGGDSAA